MFTDTDYINLIATNHVETYFLLIIENTHNNEIFH